MEENIKKAWQSLRGEYYGENYGENISDIIAGKRRTALQNLARRYRWFSNISIFFLVVWCPMFAFSSEILTGVEDRIQMSILFGVYFMICSVMDRWLYMGIKGIDCGVMDVNAVQRKALFYRKRHLQFVLILLPMALGLVGFLAYKVSEDVYMLWGIIIGILVGLAIGSRELMRFMSDYKKATE